MGTISTSHYHRIGNEVIVFGRFIATPTATGLVELYIELPVASDLIAATDLIGTGYADDFLIAVLSADTTGNRAVITASITATSARNFLYSFSYTVA